MCVLVVGADTFLAIDVGLEIEAMGGRPVGPVVNVDEAIEGAIEVHLRAGDALMFVDAICHGATNRINPGERRVAIYRYGPSWGRTRHGFVYSDALLERVTPAQRKILQPMAPRVAGLVRGLEA